MKALITGGRGYLGQRLSAALLARGHEVVRLGRSAPLNSAGGTDLVGDVRDPAVVASAARGADCIFHLAAQTSVPVAERDVEADRAINVRPMQHLLEACATAGHARAMVFASTATVFGLTRQLPVGDEGPANPITAYDRHKLEAETALREAVRRGDARGASLRLANVYGPGPESGAADRGILNAMVQKALSGAPLTVFGEGQQLRDYTYIDDVIDAFVRAGEQAQKLDGGGYVIGSGQGNSIAQAAALVADRVHARTGKRVEVKRVAPDAGEHRIGGRSFVADPQRFSALTGWHPSVDLREGIDRTIAFFEAGI